MLREAKVNTNKNSPDKLPVYYLKSCHANAEIM